MSHSIFDLFICRWLFLRAQDAWSWIHHHARSSARQVRSHHGGCPLHSRLSRRNLLVGLHSIRPRSYPHCHSRLGDDSVCHRVRVYRCRIHVLRWSVLGGVHRCCSVDVYCCGIVVDGSFLFNARRRGCYLVHARWMAWWIERRQSWEMDRLRYVIG